VAVDTKDPSHARFRLAGQLCLVLGPLLLLCSGCHRDTPAQSLRETVQALERSDREAFVSGFTARSAELLRGLFVLSSVYPKLTPPWGKPQQLQVLAETIQGSRAVVFIVNQGEKESVLMVMEDGRWRIDLFDNVPQWVGGVYFK